MRSRATQILVLALAAGALAAGCSEKTGGQPQASGAGQSTSTETSSRTPTTTRSSTAVPGSDKPCDLLSATDATSLGLGQGKPNTVGKQNICNWTASGRYSLAIGFDNKGLTGLTGENVPLEKHKAIRTLQTGGFQGCAVVVEISQTASVIITAANAAGGSQEEACPHAVQAAKIIDPKLP